MEWPVKLLCLLVLVYFQADQVLLQCNIPYCVTDNCTGDICDRCEYGRFLTSDGLCGACPTSCTTCRSLTNCTGCIPERYGTYCQNTCSRGCKDRVCDGYTGRCRDGCAPGYYLHSNNYCTWCPYCINDSCNAITGSCDIGCLDGYFISWGGFCAACSVACIDRDCDRITGACTKGCVDNHYHDKIGRCHGCSTACKDVACNVETGACTNGCIDHYYTTVTKNCEKCPIECVDRKCHGFTGSCDLGCVDQFYMTAHNVCKSCPSSCVNKSCHDKTAFCKIGCIQGYYLDGSTCSACSTRCEGKCADASGTCEQCKKGLYMDLKGSCEYCQPHCSSCSQEDAVVCNECKTGYWGDSCAMECFEGCTSGLCHLTEGYCLKGCIEGYSDKRCEIPSTRDSVVIGLSVVVGILSVLLILAIVLFIITKQREAFCSPRNVLFCLPKTKDVEARPETEGVNAGPLRDSANYVVPTLSPDDPQYTSLSVTRGYIHPVAAKDDQF